MARFPDQLRRLRQRRELLIISLFLFVIIIFWIAIGIFSSQQRSGISAEQRELAQPLSPSLDTSVIERLELKKIYPVEELQDFPIFVITDNQGQAVLIDARETAGSESVVLPSDLELELQQLEEGEN